ncbi:uncharacterized protein F4807DRAFT_6184 [Annulohypoxylon truncatum]|uniref:uncharacterized protein n=1 Tax=Annulohypoxylon truncatum TaxID=327061 RepID=UPI002007C2B2|nr:uncharacterized protein F4807DRAFT_6184 [Annulohypoxylon truncatum]KAI1214694.1 hypothetical protein F4807DRAFT_6184 [Annulohypoxylon truncatum]
MPHKHTRREKDLSTYDLPPSQIAKPLPVKSQPQPQKGNTGKPGSNQAGKNLKRKRDTAKKDDAPRAFKRLMAFAGGKKPRSGLDNGDEPTGKNKKKKAAATPKPDSDTKDSKEARELPTIRPGERMSEFAARVDAALPISGLINNSVRNGKDPLGLKAWQTKERKMHKLYDEWREEERKLKEKKEEELELQAEKELEEEEMGVTWKLDSQSGGKKKKKGKRSKYLGEVADGDEDPWEALKKKRGETKVGLHDVVQAPPEFSVKPQRKITVGGAIVEVGGIPKNAGSLRRREELQTVRDDIVASYRKMMSEKRPSLHTS